MRMNLEEGRTHRAPCASATVCQGHLEASADECRPGSQIGFAGCTFADSKKRDLRIGRHDCLAVKQLLSQQNSMLSERHLSRALHEGNVLRTWRSHDRTGNHGS